MTEKKLTARQRVFIDEYLKCFNGAEAARKAGYSVRSAREYAHDLLQDPIISSQIETRLKDSHMSADEVLKLLADMARGDMGEFLDVSGMGFNLDLQDAKQRGLTKLIKKVKQKTTIFQAKKESDEDREVHELEIELYDAQAALEKIGKHHKLFTDNVELSGTLKVEDNDIDIKSEILSKLASIATATGAGSVPVQPDTETT